MKHFSYLIKTLTVLAITLALGASVVFILKNKDLWQSSGNRQTQTSAQPVTLPNNLRDQAGALIKVRSGRFNLVFASSISPMLSGSSSSSEELLGTDKFWLPGPCSQAPHKLVGDRYFIHLDFSNQEHPTPLLQVFDLRTRQLLKPIELFQNFKGITRSDGTTVSDAIADFSVDERTDTVSYVIRRNVIRDSPDHGGTPTKDSSAELWTVSFPNGTPLKVGNFDIIPTHRLPEEGFPFDLPVIAVRQGNRYLVKWMTRIESFSESTKKRDLIATSGTIFGVDLHVSPDASRAIVSEMTGFQQSIGMIVYELKQQTLTKIAHIEGYFSQVLWSPDSELLILTSGSTLNNIRLDLNTGKLGVVETPSRKAVTPIAWLNRGEILVRIDSESREEEQPVTEDNFKVPYAVWNTTNDTFSYLQNHRTPLFLGVLTD